jgi:hypothetical protein
MNNSVTIFFVVFVLIVPWLLILIYFYIINRSIVKSYKSLSDKYGFEVDTSKKSGFLRHPVSRGSYRNISVTIGSFIKQEGKKKSASTYIEAACINPDGIDFLIAKKTNANRIKYGGGTFTINDSEFDNNFIINTNNIEKMFPLLNFSIKYKLLQTLNVGFRGELTLSGSKLKYEEKELIKSSVNLLRIEILLHLLCEISDELKENNNQSLKNKN